MASVNTPSPVLMIRSVPPGKTEKDLQDWAQSFDYQDPMTGQMRKTVCPKSLLLSERQIGFVQMGSLEEAMFIMNIYATQPQRVKIDNDHLNLIYSDKQEITAAKKSRNQISTSQTRILLVVLKELSATIMMDELFWIFSQFGVVEKLSSFTKNSKNQVLVQYMEHDQASQAMAYLNGRVIQFDPLPAQNGMRAQPGRCELAIVPSKLPELTFKNQDQKNRDYTQINEHLKQQFVSVAMDRNKLQEQLQLISQKCGWRVRNFLWGQWVMGDGWLDPRQDGPQGQIPVSEGAQRGIPEGQVGHCVHISEITQDKMAQRFGYASLGPRGIEAMHLWRLCGIYGDIVAVKMLYKYEGSAIVQFKTTEYANACIEYMKGVKLWGREWEVKRSKNSNAMHWSGAKTELDSRMVTIMTEEAPPSPPVQNFAPPNEQLVMYDAPDGLVEDDIVQLMLDNATMPGGTYGRVDNVEFEPGLVKITMSTVEDAVLAVALMNGRTVCVGNKTFMVKLYFERPVPMASMVPRALTNMRGEEPEMQQPPQPSFMGRTFTA